LKKRVRKKALKSSASLSRAVTPKRVRKKRRSKITNNTSRRESETRTGKEEEVDTQQENAVATAASELHPLSVVTPPVVIPPPRNKKGVRLKMRMRGGSVLLGEPYGKMIEKNDDSHTTASNVYTLLTLRPHDPSRPGSHPLAPGAAADSTVDLVVPVRGNKHTNSNETNIQQFSFPTPSSENNNEGVLRTDHDILVEEQNRLHLAAKRAQEAEKEREQARHLFQENTLDRGETAKGRSKRGAEAGNFRIQAPSASREIKKRVRTNMKKALELQTQQGQQQGREEQGKKKDGEERLQEQPHWQPAQLQKQEPEVPQSQKTPSRQRRGQKEKEGKGRLEHPEKEEAAQLQSQEQRQQRPPRGAWRTRKPISGGEIQQQSRGSEEPREAHPDVSSHSGSTPVQAMEELEEEFSRDDDYDDDDESREEEQGRTNPQEQRREEEQGHSNLAHNLEHEHGKEKNQDREQFSVQANEMDEYGEDYEVQESEDEEEEEEEWDESEDQQLFEDLERYREPTQGEKEDVNKGQEGEEEEKEEEEEEEGSVEHTIRATEQFEAPGRHLFHEEQELGGPIKPHSSEATIIHPQEQKGEGESWLTRRPQKATTQKAEGETGLKQDRVKQSGLQRRNYNEERGVEENSAVEETSHSPVRDMAPVRPGIDISATLGNCVYFKGRYYEDCRLMIHQKFIFLCDSHGQETSEQMSKVSKISRLSERPTIYVMKLNGIGLERHEKYIIFRHPEHQTVVTQFMGFGVNGEAFKYDKIKMMLMLRRWRDQDKNNMQYRMNHWGEGSRDRKHRGDHETKPSSGSLGPEKAQSCSMENGEAPSYSPDDQVEEPTKHGERKRRRTGVLKEQPTFEERSVGSGLGLELGSEAQGSFDCVDDSSLNLHSGSSGGPHGSSLRRRGRPSRKRGRDVTQDGHLEGRMREESSKQERSSKRSRRTGVQVERDRVRDESPKTPLAGAMKSTPSEGLHLDGEQLYDWDIDRLKKNEFLNDACINFIIKFLQVFVVPDYGEMRDNFFSYSTFFYSRLEGQAKDGETGHANVKNWTRPLRKEAKTGIFERKFISVPINNENLHWWLALIVDPSHACSMEREYEKFGPKSTALEKVKKAYKGASEQRSHSPEDSLALFEKNLALMLEKSEREFRRAQDRELEKHLRKQKRRAASLREEFARGTVDSNLEKNSSSSFSRTPQNKILSLMDGEMEQTMENPTGGEDTGNIGGIGTSTDDTLGVASCSPTEFHDNSVVSQETKQHDMTRALVKYPSAHTPMEINTTPSEADIATQEEDSEDDSATDSLHAQDESDEEGGGTRGEDDDGDGDGEGDGEEEERDYLEEARSSKRPRREKKKREDNRLHPGPYILLLDSASDSQADENERNGEYLKGYLKEEWSSIGLPPEKFEKDLIKTVTCKVPKQRNGVDCGIFLIEYLLRFISNPHLLEEVLRPDSSRKAFGFGQTRCTERREELRKFGERLMEEARNRDCYDVRLLLSMHPKLKDELFQYLSCDN